MLAVIVTLGLSALMMPLLGQWSVGAFVILSVGGLAYGGAPVAMQTWVFNADAETANESGSGMFVATFQFSIAFGSFFGGIVVDRHSGRDVRGRRPRPDRPCDYPAVARPAP